MKKIMYAASILVVAAATVFFAYQSYSESEYLGEITIKPRYRNTAQKLLDAYNINSKVDSDGLIVKGDRSEHVKINLILDNAGLIDGVISKVEVVNVKSAEDNALGKETLKETVSTLENRKIIVRGLVCGEGPENRISCMLYLWKQPENFDTAGLKKLVFNKLNLNPKSSQVGIKLTAPKEFARKQPIIKQK